MYADDLAIIAEDENGLQSMLKTLEKWSISNLMVVSTEKTKAMPFRRGGKRRKGVTSWKFSGKVLEKVKEFKYLGFWFSIRYQYGTHTRKVEGRLQKLINKAWGEIKRAAVNSLARRSTTDRQTDTFVKTTFSDSGGLKTLRFDENFESFFT